MISPEIQKKYGAGMFGPLGDIYTGDALDMLRTLPGSIGAVLRDLAAVLGAS